jgi:hypothetical protein
MPWQSGGDYSDHTKAPIKGGKQARILAGWPIPKVADPLLLDQSQNANRIVGCIRLPGDNAGCVCHVQAPYCANRKSGHIVRHVSNWLLLHWHALTILDDLHPVEHIDKVDLSQ